MLIGIDDTDSPAGMCTTYLGAVLMRRFRQMHMQVREARIVRLNPNVTFKTRGNAAICLELSGDPKEAFRVACCTVDELADFSCENTNPGVVLVQEKPSADFYRQAVTDFCEIREAVDLLERSGALYKGYKNRRGLIGATAAVCSDLPDRTYELLAYRRPGAWKSLRQVDRRSLFDAEAATFPHTWDSVDPLAGMVVCVPHSPDPVLFGIRGESPGWVSYARSFIRTEETEIEELFVTNQGTDAHLIPGETGTLKEGCSYLLTGIVATGPDTGPGGHVSFRLADRFGSVRCMAYEPTKSFRNTVRGLIPGDSVTVAGSYKGGSINLEKICIRELISPATRRPPLCHICGKRMTSAGREKGYKCRACGARASDPEYHMPDRTVAAGWYEVPPSARRHLARPLCRGGPDAGPADGRDGMPDEIRVKEA
jgi:tRNA(Ile2)-agmatinylcytidine synthase